MIALRVYAELDAVEGSGATSRMERVARFQRKRRKHLLAAVQRTLPSRVSECWLFSHAANRRPSSSAKSSPEFARAMFLSAERK